MKNLKRFLSALICCTIMLGSTGTAFAEIGDTNKLGNGDQQIQKEEMLALVDQQLKDQNAEKFYPIYEQMINDMYNNSPTTNSLMKAKT